MTDAPTHDPEAEAFDARHLRMLRRLGDLLMEVAEGAAEQAKAEQADQRAYRAQGVQEHPGELPIPTRAGYYSFHPVTREGPIEPPLPTGCSAALLLCRISDAVQRVIALERRIVTEAGCRPRSGGGRDAATDENPASQPAVSRPTLGTPPPAGYAAVATLPMHWHHPVAAVEGGTGPP